MPENTETHDVIQVAQDAVEPARIAEGVYLARDSDGDVSTIDVRDLLQDDQALYYPRRKTGHLNVTTVEAFADYVAKHGVHATELWGSRDRGVVQAVINAHSGFVGDDEPVLNYDEDGQPGLAGWGDHTITLVLRHSDDWNDWTKRDGQMMSQVDFAEFLEDHRPNLGEPSPAEMLELAQTFRATTKVDFDSSQRLKSGETSLTYAESTDAKAGRKGSIAIPDQITIALPVYDQGIPYPLSARFRYRIGGGQLLLGYRLDRPKDTLQLAFDRVVADVEDKTSRTVWATT